jgi:hydroxymethylglutaryl-CoA lyase
MNKIKIIECPRDAMQGIPDFIPTHLKISYINALLKVGFDTIDVGSFVSPKMIPQMRDTPEVLNNLDLSNSKTKLLGIIGNKKGAERASSFEQISYLGYPFSISETFQIRNTNANLEESLDRLRDIQDVCAQHNKTLVVYLSMGFGNPYGDSWSENLVSDWTLRLKDEFGVKIVSLSDTIGIADPDTIKSVFKSVLPYSEGIEIGAHLHAKPNEWQNKVQAAIDSQCYRIDGAIMGLGGCPYATDQLTGNIPTEGMIAWLEQQQLHTGIDHINLNAALKLSHDIFQQFT